MSVDIHKQEKAYNAKLEAIERLSAGKNKEILNKYVEWHNYQIEQNNMAYSSSVRSLRHALNICDYFPDVTKATQKKVEKWFAEEMNKEKVHKTSIGTLKKMGCKRSPETLEDISTQAIKFFKFVRFLEKDKPLYLFSSKRSPMPAVCEFIGVDIVKRKQYEKPKVKQEQIKELIEWLRKQGTYNNDLTGVLVSLLNDSGMRFGEAVTIRIMDVVSEEDYLVISLQESKTRTRTIVSILSKPYLINWLAKHPKKDDPKALLFCNRQGKPINYDALRRCFKKGLEALNINWKNGSSFHYLRHLFASRATSFPDFYLKYWLGWHDKSMRSHYTNNTYLECLKYYKQMLREEHNCMLDNYLSVLEKEEKKLSSSLEDRIKAMEKILEAVAGGINAEDFIDRKLKEVGKS